MIEFLSVFWLHACFGVISAAFAIMLCSSDGQQLPRDIDHATMENRNFEAIAKIVGWSIASTVGAFGVIGGFGWIAGTFLFIIYAAWFGITQLFN